ncbi:transcriptional activator NhaR [Cupriavidus sp. 30B13]|uniref:transcriptional activator NhaR n=1 Tax=Cupriavidus sp. 30B13 TaxID=3384241 RepID=UPI003B914178
MNFKHLYYFWMAARSGGIVRAGTQLHVTPQTLSGQIKLLEERFGCALFERDGRNIRLTDQGRVAFRYADEIFSLGAQLESALKPLAAAGAPAPFKVGIADSIPKPIAYRLLEPAMAHAEAVRIVCREGGLPALLTELEAHRLDLVLSDSPHPQAASARAVHHHLGQSGIAIFAGGSLGGKCTAAFPACLHGAPMLMPGIDSALRPRVEGWLTEMGIRPLIVGEFDDDALMLAFGREGRGVFAASAALEEQLLREHGVRLLGTMTDVFDEFYAISIAHRACHPSVSRIANALRGELLS